MSTAESPLDRLERPSPHAWLGLLPWALVAVLELVCLVGPAWIVGPEAAAAALAPVLLLEILVVIPALALREGIDVSRRWAFLLRRMPWEELCLTPLNPQQIVEWIVEPVRRDIRNGARFLACSTPACMILAALSTRDLDPLAALLCYGFVPLVYRHILLQTGAHYAVAITFRAILYELEIAIGLAKALRQFLLFFGGFLLTLLAPLLVTFLVFLIEGVAGDTESVPLLVLLTALFATGAVALMLPLFGIILLPFSMFFRRQKIMDALTREAALWQGTEGRQHGYTEDNLLSFPRALFGKVDPPPSAAVPAP